MLCAMEFKNRLVCLFLEGTITTKMFQFQRSKEFQWSLQLQFVIGIYPWICRIIRDQEINGNRLNAFKLPTYRCVYLSLFDHSVAIQKFLTLNNVFKTWLETTLNICSSSFFEIYKYCKYFQQMVLNSTLIFFILQYLFYHWYIRCCGSKGDLWISTLFTSLT